MGQTLSAWQQRARDLLGDPAVTLISAEAMERHVKTAVRRFSRDVARIRYTDYAGNGSTYDLAISSLTGWVNGFSSVEAIEHPQGQRTPVYLDQASFTLWPRDSAPTAVRLLDVIPASGETSRVFYTAAWPIPDANPATDLIADTDFEPIVHYAAAEGALQMAGRAAGHQRNTFSGADLVGEQTEESRWRSQATALRKVYLDHVGAGDDGQPAAAMAVIDWDAASTWPQTGRRFLFRDPRR